jgi:hypothetical protein
MAMTQGIKIQCMVKVSVYEILYKS